MSRPDAREQALIALYTADINGAPGFGSLPTRARELAERVWEKQAELDETISGASDRWRVERMPVVDRNVLRLAAFELRYQPDLPVGVIINEAVRLAKQYSTAKSGGFVNGVLGRIAHAERAPTP